MTNAEKEARKIVEEIKSDFPVRDLAPHVARILRFAREYGPEMAGVEPDANAGLEPVGEDAYRLGRMPRMHAVDPSAPDWTRLGITRLRFGGNYAPERGKPF